MKCIFFAEKFPLSVFIFFQDEAILQFEKERKEAENNLRRKLALETEAALAQQERDLATLIGRLEVQYMCDMERAETIYFDFFSHVFV